VFAELMQSLSKVWSNDARGPIIEIPIFLSETNLETKYLKKMETKYEK